jgi:predicted  nucleic acid-binding Zn-ribbon protein
LKQTLHWLLAKINKVNELADKFVQQVPPGSTKTFNKDAHRAANGVTRDGLSDIMKRRIDDELQRPILDDNSSASRVHQRRRSLALALSNEELPPIRTQSPYHHTPLSMDSSNTRLPNMNPPPAPTRQLPSPPSRSFPSPTSVHFSSPSGSTFGGPAGGHPQPSSIHASENVLPPITGGQSADSALQAHTAALQHEVSIQKIALSSLQGEHDKLLAAFSRSQSRASALEKKHQVSDGEIFSLTEERARLQAQVQELEGDVEELSKSRDSYRQAAVQEGAQYVEIVKMASQLEEKTGEERKNWNKLKLEMEQRIAELSAGINTHTKDPMAAASSSPTEGGPIPNTTSSNDKMDIDAPSAMTTANTHDKTQDERADHLKAEIERLRKRCEEVEGALRAVREESRSMANMIEALSKAGKGILRRVEDVSLGPEPPQAEVKSEPPPIQQEQQEPDSSPQEENHEEDIQ